MVKRSKYKVNYTKKGKDKRTFEGREFASELELKFYTHYLLPLKEKGEIQSIIIQPKYVLQEGFKKYGKKFLPIYYVGDFEVVFSNSEIITYDVKGLASECAKIKRKLFDKKYPNKNLIWIGYSVQDGGWIDYDILKKLRLKRKREKK